MSATHKQHEVQPTAGSPAPLRPQNQRLLEFLEELAAEPDDLGDAWWDEFRAWLHKNRVRFGGPDEV